MLETVNLAEKFSRFSDQWSPKLVGELNGQYVKLARLEGEFHWHAHAEEDELFLVVRGHLRIELRDGVVELGPGELVVVYEDLLWDGEPVAAMAGRFRSLIASRVEIARP